MIGERRAASAASARGLRAPVVLAALAPWSALACGAAAHDAPEAPDAAVDAAPAPPPAPAWWQPRPGDARDWDIQLAAPFDLAAPRAAYDVDLWSVVPAPTVLDYGDGAPITVPAGAQAGAIAALHARTPRAVVICHVDTGALELDRPDAAKFPGYSAKLTACPAGAPTAGSAIGHSAGGPRECYLDVRAASRPSFAPLVWKRLDLARQIGCDAVDGDRNDMLASTPGF